MKRFSVSWTNAVRNNEKVLGGFENVLLEGIAACGDVVAQLEGGLGMLGDVASRLDRLSDKFDEMVDLVDGWRAVAMMFYDYHNVESQSVYGHVCGCDRCEEVRGMLRFEATSSMVE